MVVNIPIVTLDKIYIKPDEKNIFFLDCTRINGSNEIVTRKGMPIDGEIERLKTIGKEIILADDVVFSGTVLNTIIKKFSERGVQVVGIISSICAKKAYNTFKETLKYGVRTNFLMEENIIDQICERDFYFGVAGSGIMVKTENGLYKAPYFKPFGNPYERASIPKEYEDFFSKGCIDRSLYLWEEIQRLKQSKILMNELPERIVGTQQDEEVIKVLKKGRNI